MRGITDAPLGDAAFWLEETLALRETIAENLPRLWPDEPPGEEPAAEALFAADIWPEVEQAVSAAASEAFTPAAAGRRSERKPESIAAAGERGERRPQVSPGATHIVRRERDEATDFAASGTLKQRESVPETVSAPATAPDLLNEWSAEPMQELTTTHMAETLPEVWREIDAAVDYWPAAGEVILAPEFYGLTAEQQTAADGVPNPMDMLPGAAFEAPAAEESQAAGTARVIRQAAGGSESGIESSLPRLAESSTVFREAAAVDIDELAETVAERLRERLEIILQSRPFV